VHVHVWSDGSACLQVCVCAVTCLPLLSRASLCLSTSVQSRLSLSQYACTITMYCVHHALCSPCTVCSDVTRCHMSREA
jgi:hypothetical protein